MREEIQTHSQLVYQLFLAPAMLRRHQHGQLLDQVLSDAREQIDVHVEHGRHMQCLDEVH